MKEFIGLLSMAKTTSPAFIPALSAGESIFILLTRKSTGKNSLTYNPVKKLSLSLASKLLILFHYHLHLSIIFYQPDSLKLNQD